MNTEDGKITASELAGELIAADVEASLALAANQALLAVERQPIPVLDQMSAIRHDNHVRHQLVDAGEGILKVLERVAHDEDMWRSLSAALAGIAKASPISLQNELDLREILAHNITAMLLSLGYPLPPPPPPPPVDEWAKLAQDPLQRLLTVPGDPRTAKQRAVVVRKKLLEFVLRFRRVLATFRAELSPPGTKQLKHSPRRVLAAAIEDARKRAIPSGIGAVAGRLAVGGGAILVSGALGGPPAAAAAASVSLIAALGEDGAKQLVKNATEAMVIEWLDGQRSGPPATAEEQWRADLDLASEAFAVLSSEAVKDTDDINCYDWTFIATRQLFALMPTVNAYLREKMLRIVDLLRAGRYKKAQRSWDIINDRLRDLSIRVGARR